MNDMSHQHRAHSHNPRYNRNINFLGFIVASLISLFLQGLEKICPSWIHQWIKWCPTSPQTLEVIEKELLSGVESQYALKYVNIGHCWSAEDNFIWTMSITDKDMASRTPLVLLHGFASGIGLWVCNVDRLSLHCPIYAFDILGFGRSSRPEFSTDASEAEQQFVTSIEMWRRAVSLDKMILLGHGMGGFLATAYALEHPDRVAMLILVDPWGFPDRPISHMHKYDMPQWVKFITTFLYGFNLLALVRAAGPIGPTLVDLFRRDLQRKYSKCLQNRKSITGYIYHCNAQHPSGEVGFKAMADESGWAKDPMIGRIGHLHWKIPMMFIYGSRSWVNRQPALQIKYSRLNSYVDIQVIENAGHHVYADQPEQFCAIVHDICQRLENSEILH